MSNETDVTDPPETQPAPAAKLSDPCTLCHEEGMEPGAHKKGCPKEGQAAAEPEYAFPQVGPEEFGGSHLDTKTNILWIAIKIEAMDYVGALAFLHSMEHVLWQFYREIIRQNRLKAALAQGVQPQPAPKQGIRERLGI